MQNTCILGHAATFVEVDSTGSRTSGSVRTQTGCWDERGQPIVGARRSTSFLVRVAIPDSPHPRSSDPCHWGNRRDRTGWFARQALNWVAPCRSQCALDLDRTITSLAQHRQPLGTTKRSEPTWQVTGRSDRVCSRNPFRNPAVPISPNAGAESGRSGQFNSISIDPKAVCPSGSPPRLGRPRGSAEHLFLVRTPFLHLRQCRSERYCPLPLFRLFYREPKLKSEPRRIGETLCYSSRPCFFS